MGPIPSLPQPSTDPPPGRRHGRDPGLRFTLVCAVAGAVVTLLTAGRGGTGEATLALGAGVLAVGGAGILAGLAWAGMALLIGAAALAFHLGSYWLAPAAAAGAFRAAHRSQAARRLLGLLLLVPGVAAIHIATLAALSYVSGQPLPGLPDAVNPPLDWSSALQGLWLLPVAIAGAWLLSDRDRRR